MRNIEDLKPKWIDEVGEVDRQDGKHFYICPVCRKAASYFLEDDDCFHAEMPNYCPYCGERLTP